MIFSKKLITWYLQNKRALPWRATRDPYKIWLSEIMLQQTRVAQGLPYYESFLGTFPTVFDMAAASEETILKLWQGLGYYSRARNLHQTAKHIAYERDGVFPDNYKDLLELKGVGDYTASAIASISFNEVVPVVDGNVYRVLSRYFNIDTPINSSKGIKQFKKLAKELIDHDQPAVYNQAIMEFGAIQCKPKNPYCLVCPLHDSCEALKNRTVDQLPVKLKKTKIKNRYFNYLIFDIDGMKTVIKQRKGKGIWQHLYEFPLLETAKEIGKEHIVLEDKFKKMTRDQPYELTVYNTTSKIHKLSHQHLHTKFLIVRTGKIPHLENDHMVVNKNSIHDYPVPILLGNFIDEYF